MYSKCMVNKLKLTVVLALLAASAQNRCTALVCSCYVPSRSFGSKSEESNRSSISKKRLFAASSGCSNSRISGTNGSHMEPVFNLRSNLKKTTSTVVMEAENEYQVKTERRKVTWPDAHGKDIAHVREFEPSTASEDGELEGVRNSCVCAIQ